MTDARRTKKHQVGVIDIFAGPGGLGEGFSSFITEDGRSPFSIGVSAEMEPAAHATLRLRAFYRALTARHSRLPSTFERFLSAHALDRRSLPQDHFRDGTLAAAWQNAGEEALHLTLGVEAHNATLYEHIRRVKKHSESLVLIGGPPCQAYSIVGRARQANVPGFRSFGDHRHFLYRQYLQILREFKPDVFIMENVKGILSSKVGESSMFELICSDLANPTAALTDGVRKFGDASEYVLLPVDIPAGVDRTNDFVASDASKFLVRCEDHGIAQARHRVIVMGVRRSFLSAARLVPGLRPVKGIRRLDQTLKGLPHLRSSLSRTLDSDGSKWAHAVESERRRIINVLGDGASELKEALRSFQPGARLPVASTKRREDNARGHAADGISFPLFNHETRSHMQSDLGRYLFCAAYAMAEKRSPSSREFPSAIRPDHDNWHTGAFADRFRVQLPDRPATTLTSHLAKDGHAFIHWDLSQCRSMTVREAARIQTFPDDYIFLGNRSQQYVQVGNAVPPALAKQIAQVVWSVLNK